MAGSWSAIDWAADRPTWQDVQRSWERLAWVARPVTDPEVHRYLAEVARTHVNGGYVIGRWAAVRYDQTASWFIARNRLEEYELMARFFEDPVVAADLEPLGLIGRAHTPAGVLDHDWGGGLTLDGRLASVIVGGGAYEKFEGPAHAAKDLAAAAVDALIDRRYEDVHVHTTHAAWGPWFNNIAWDRTFVITDKKRAEITVLCITDVD